MLMEICA
jgi:hypothetical protein